MFCIVLETAPKILFSPPAKPTPSEPKGPKSAKETKLEKTIREQVCTATELLVT